MRECYFCKFEIMATRCIYIVLALTVCLTSLVTRSQDLTDRQPADTSVVTSKVLQESKVTIRNIVVTGNKKTKEHIVKREIPFLEGQAYPMSDILASLPKSRLNLINTSLFVDASVDFTNWYNDSLDILVDVKERWYWFPIPIFKPVDRNWNVWINQYNVSFDRVNYGLKFMGRNISGRNDNLTVFIQSGYTKLLQVTYVNPYLGKSLKHGFSVDMSFGRNREVNYTTRNNEQMFYKSNSNFVRDRLMIGGGYSYRKGSIERHNVKLNYTLEKVVDSVLYYNPKYFGGGGPTQGFPELLYTYQYLGVNYFPYPTKGFRWDFAFLKRGISKPMNMWYFNVKAAKYWPLPAKFFVSVQGEFNLKVPFDQPFYNQALLGYGDTYLRGLEYYVVDGVAGGMLRTTLRKQIFDIKWKTGFNSRAYGSIPFKIFIKGYGDMGYAYNKNNVTSNFLTNRPLYTGGLGIDILTIYDVVFKIEYSFNQLGQRAPFIHMNEF
jgi:outer membrane protein assembly factor BamA